MNVYAEKRSDVCTTWSVHINSHGGGKLESFDHRVCVGCVLGARWVSVRGQSRYVLAGFRFRIVSYFLWHVSEGFIVLLEVLFWANSLNLRSQVTLGRMEL